LKIGQELKQLPPQAWCLPFLGTQHTYTYITENQMGSGYNCPQECVLVTHPLGNMIESLRNRCNNYKTVLQSQLW